MTGVRCPFCDQLPGETIRLRKRLLEKGLENIGLHLAVLKAQGDRGLITDEMRELAEVALRKAQEKILRLALCGARAR